MTASASSHTKVNLARLLRSCEQLSASLSASGSHGSAARRADRRRFETYLSVLQRMWHDLANSSGLGATTAGGSGVSEALLSEYRRKIERLAELLDAEKMISGSGSALALTQAQCNGSLTREQANAELSSRLKTTTCMQQAVRSQLLQPAAAPGSDQGSDGLAGGDPAGGAGGESSAASVASSGAPGGGSESAQSLPGRAPFAAAFGRRGGGGGGGSGSGIEAEALQSTLAEQRELHDNLLADLADSVGQLRDRSLQARSAVRDDLHTLDSTSTQLDGNRAKLDENNSRLRAATNAMRSSTCMICLMLIVVCALFVGTFLMMKIVPKRPRAAAPPIVQVHGAEL